MARRGGCFKRRSPAANQAALVGSQREAEPKPALSLSALCVRPALFSRLSPGLNANNTGTWWELRFATFSGGGCCGLSFSPKFPRGAISPSLPFPSSHFNFLIPFSPSPFINFLPAFLFFSLLNSPLSIRCKKCCPGIWYKSLGGGLKGGWEGRRRWDWSGWGFFKGKSGKENPPLGYLRVSLWVWAK